MSLQFDLQQQNAEKYEEQSRVFKRKRERLKDAGAFRVQIEQRQGTGLARRGYKPTYEKQVVRLTDIDSSEGAVTGRTASGTVEHSIREVMPVPPDSTTVRDPPGEGEGSRTLYDKVFAFLNMPRTPQRIRKHIGAEGMQIIKDNRLQNLKRFMKHWGFHFAGGKWERGEAASGSAGSVRQTTLK